MINFRYHIVSLVAVFLALAIGVVMGTTVIDSATIDVLERQQDQLDRRIEEVRAENAGLHDELDRLHERDDQLAEQAGVLVEGRLSDVPVLTIGARGLDEGLVSQLDDLVVDAGGRHQGTLWITERMALENDEDISDLAAALGVDTNMPVGALRSKAVDALAHFVGTAASPGSANAGPTAIPDPPSDEVTGERSPGDAVAALVEAGYLDVDRPEGVGGDEPLSIAPGTRTLVVSGTGARVRDEAVAVPLVSQLSTLSAVVAAQETPSEQADGASFVGRVRERTNVSTRVATVDHLHLFEGRVAVVYTLADLGRGIIGHYGVTEGASQRLPPPVP